MKHTFKTNVHELFLKLFFIYFSIEKSYYPANFFWQDLVRFGKKKWLNLLNILLLYKGFIINKFFVNLKIKKIQINPDKYG